EMSGSTRRASTSSTRYRGYPGTGVNPLTPPGSRPAGAGRARRSMGAASARAPPTPSSIAAWAVLEKRLNRGELCQSENPSGGVCELRLAARCLWMRLAGSAEHSPGAGLGCQRQPPLTRIGHREGGPVDEQQVIGVADGVALFRE